jgi:hypothetical protein
MYYKSVNRGLSFTKVGWYAILFIFGVGMVAVNTGANGMFIFLSLGLALLVISGLLSEKTIKHYESRNFAPCRVEANKKFTLSMHAVNTSQDFALYGMESLVLGEGPRFGWIRTRMKIVGKGVILKLAPADTRTVEVLFEPMGRGVHTSFDLVLRTNFPFGLIEKFKLSRINGELVVLPEKNVDLAAAIRSDFQRRLAQTAEDREFWSHKPWQQEQGKREIDWKKSAGRPMNQWVAREFRSSSANFGVKIRTNWTALTSSQDAKTWENHLAALRTACDVVAEGGRFIALQIDNNLWMTGHDAILVWIARLPQWNDRMTRRDISAAEPTSSLRGEWLEIEVSGDSWHWIESSGKVA